jgi:hypothetical protein
MKADIVQLLPVGMVAPRFQGGIGMHLVCRNETGLPSSVGFLGALRIALLSGLVVTGGPVWAQQDAPMDDQDSVTIICDDGTELQAAFDDKGVEITFANGTKVSLPQGKSNDDSYSYSNGKFTLNGNDESAEWTVGRRVPVACKIKDDTPPTPFDAPITIDADPLPADKANPDAQPQVNCYRFPGFMVKEVDLGEKGAEKLAITPQNAACKRDAAKDEKVVKDDIAGYFLGVKGNFAFFQGSDGWNGGMPFVVYDAKTMKRLFEDSFEGEDFHSIDTDGTNLTLNFRRSYTADCSLYLDGGDCAARLRKMIGLGGIAKIPECGPAYEAEKKRTPDYAKEIEQLPSVISYEAVLKFDGKMVNVSPLAGDTGCHVPD